MDKRNLVGKGRTVAATLFLSVALCGVAGAEIYQWRDSQGRLHFGDEPPAGGKAENLTEQYDYSLPFSLNFETVDYSLPPKLRNDLGIAVKKIFAIYKQALGVEYEPERDFSILLYGNEQAFREHQREVAPRLENPIGFYSSETNRITALAVPDTRALVALITHECSHAVSASRNRYVPIWLNEGLAEYFSHLRVYGLTAEVPVARHWLSTLRRRGYHRDAPELTRYLNALPPAWQEANGPESLSYALSWSLVYFMMDSPQGRDILRALLERAKNTPLPLLDSAGFIGQRWEGGLDAFSRQWQQWLASADGKHRY